MYRRRAYLKHYTDFMEFDEIAEADNALARVIGGYQSIQDGCQGNPFKALDEQASLRVGKASPEKARRSAHPSTPSPAKLASQKDVASVEPHRNTRQSSSTGAMVQLFPSF